MTIPSSIRAVDGGKIKGAQAVPSVIEIMWTTGLPGGKVSHNKVHGHYTTAPPNMQTLVNALTTAISSAWSSNLAPLMSTLTALQGVFIRDMTATTNPIFQGTLTAVPGTGVGNAMPNENAIVVTENVTSRGRGLKGRFYLGGFVVGENTTAGGITPAAQTAINGFGTALFNAITAQSLTPCVAQVARQQYIGLTGAVHQARQANFVAVTSYVCADLAWDTQRRRGF